jgi:hypothetical protein
VVEIINLQPRDGKAKAYQVKQVRGLITSYGLAEEPAPAEPKTKKAPRKRANSGEAEANDGG